MKKIVPADSVLIPDNATLAFQGQIFGVYQWPQSLFDGSPATFEMLRRPDTVNVLAITDDHKILVLDDEQPHTGSRKCLPGGRVDPEDESIEAAAKRELLEETGYAFKNWRLIRVQQPHTKIEWFTCLLVAWGVESRQEPHLDAGEKITLSEVSFEELKTLSLNKSSFLNDLLSIIEDLKTVDDLVALPEFQGRTIDR